MTIELRYERAVSARDHIKKCRGWFYRVCDRFIDGRETQHPVLCINLDNVALVMAVWSQTSFGNVSLATF